MRLTYARQIRIDERTDIREEVGPAYEDDLQDLQALLDTGRARLEPGLMGWGQATHTLRTDDWGNYHVAVEEDAEEEGIDLRRDPADYRP